MIKLPDDSAFELAFRGWHPNKTGPYVKHQMQFMWYACIAEVQRLNATAQPVSDEHARIADALESLLWPNMAIGNKAIILCAIKALRGIPAAPGGQDD